MSLIQEATTMFSSGNFVKSSSSSSEAFFLLRKFDRPDWPSFSLSAPASLLKMKRGSVETGMNDISSFSWRCFFSLSFLICSNSS